jgi:hypothetical protein
MNDTQITPACKESLMAVLEAIQIESNDSFRFFSSPPISVKDETISREDPFFHEDPFLYALRKRIYMHFHAGIPYLPPSAEAPSATQPPSTHREEADFRESLSRAHGTRGRFDDGWIVRTVFADQSLAAEKDARVRVWRPGQYIFDGAPSIAKTGNTVRIWINRESFTLQPGFFHVFGTNFADEVDEMGCARFYLNLTATGAAAATGLLTSQFEARSLPFHFKCFSHPESYIRCDSGVLYIPLRFAHFAAMLLTGIYPQLRPHLGDHSPMLAKKLASGIAVAEEPDTGDSFGAHRALAIAKGLVAAHAAQQTKPLQRLHCILRSFEESNVDPSRPHLNLHHSDAFSLDTLELDV